MVYKFLTGIKKNITGHVMIFNLINLGDITFMLEVHDFKPQVSPLEFFLHRSPFFQYISIPHSAKQQL